MLLTLNNSCRNIRELEGSDEADILVLLKTVEVDRDGECRRCLLDHAVLTVALFQGALILINLDDKGE